MTERNSNLPWWVWALSSVLFAWLGIWAMTQWVWILPESIPQAIRVFGTMAVGVCVGEAVLYFIVWIAK